LRRTVEAAPDLGIGVLTLFAFSSDNWRRPPEEVAGLMQLLAEHLRAETSRCLENSVRLEVIGRRDRLGGELPAAIAQAEAATAAGAKLQLRIAVDYSGRDAIAEAVRHAAHSGLVCRECLEEQLGPPVDLLIRTGGEQRLSDFLLWECAYAELIFSRRMWPDFDAPDLEAAVRQFHARQRRFGAIPAMAAAAATATASHAWLD
jgi:undecaprenyl diphosphate synthase